MITTTLRQAPAGFNRNLHGLRGLLALGVVVGHCGITDISSVSVWFFFVLSGYLLAKVYAGGMRPGQLGPYAVRRAARLVPLYAVVLVAIALVPGWVYDALLTAHSAAKFEAVAASFVQHLTFTRGNIHFWTLSQEALGYALIAALLLLRARLGAGRFVILCIVIAVLSEWPALTIPMPSDDGVRPFYALHFALGVAAAQVPADGTPKRWASAIALALLAAVLVASFFASAIKQAFQVPHWHVVIPAQSWGLIGALIILGLGHGTDVLGRFGFLGTISYGTYMFHFLVLLVVASMASSYDPYLIFLEVAAVTFALAWLSYRYIEAPCIAWAHRVTRRRAPEVAAAN